eukprot:gene7777-10565_t
MVTIGGKKISTSLAVILSILVGVGLGLFGLNMWHTSKCSSAHSPEEIEEFIEAINKRLLQSESQILKNELLMNNILNSVQKTLLKLEKEEYERISKESNDEAIKLTLLLASYPAPPMPEFPLDIEYLDAEKLADAIDDTLGKIEDDKEYKSGFDVEYSSKESSSSISLSDADAIKVCTEWKNTYQVSVGVSWGNLPYDLQKKWLEYSCDYHLNDNNNSGNSNAIENNSNTINNENIDPNSVGGGESSGSDGLKAELDSIAAEQD